MTDTLRDKLNPLYAKLFGPFFDSPTIEEPRATCENCAMCDHGQLAPVQMGYFNPDTKCCTYHPTLPNYLVGAILSDDTPELEEGRRRLRAKIAARTGVMPMSLAAPRKYLLLYRQSRNVFGRSKTMLCPYYSSEGEGSCTVWKWREAVCSTFFCKYQNGLPGFTFWNSDKDFLVLVQQRLSFVLAAAVDRNVSLAPEADPIELTQEDLEDLPPSDAEYAALWGSWVGREEEFYKETYAKAVLITPETFAENVEQFAPIAAKLKTVEKNYQAIHGELVLPERLVRTSKLWTREAGDSIVISSYNRNDAFALDRELYGVLAKLDGTRTLAENLARLDREEDIQLEPELLEFLFTHGVISAADAAPVDATQPAPPETEPAPPPAPVSAPGRGGAPTRNQKKAERRRNR